MNNMRNKFDLSVEPYAKINFTWCSSEPISSMQLKENVDFPVWIGEVLQGLSPR